MKEIIPFKKDIIFNTKIAKITDISLTHDYKILENVIEGDFLLSGTYKMTEASVMNEEFIYNIPFSIAVGDDVEKESINLILHDFKYEVKGDIMTIKVELDMSCEEKKQEKIYEKEEDEIEKSIDEIIDKNVYRDIEVEEEKKDILFKEYEVNAKEQEEAKESIMSITNKVKKSNDTVTYKVYIVRENDTVETIASKYNVAINDLSDYNDIESISIGDKIVIPYVKNE